SAEFGHMGDGTRDENAHPTPMAMPYQDAVSVRLSRWANHVITKTGELWVAGIDNHGQLPFETKTAKRVTGIDAVRDAVGSYNVGCILTEAKGEVLCRGDNALGEVGDGTTEDRNTYTPTKLSGVTSMAAGEHFFCAVSGSGKVPCWGDNSKGQMGDGQGGDGKTRKTPMGLSLPGEIVEVAASSQHVCARTNDGDVYCWGINWGGQAGTSNGTQCGPHDCIKSPKKVPVQNAVALALADAASCAVLSNGTVQCWGESSLTEGAKALTDVVEIASGQEANHFCVRTSSPDEVLCWGDSDSAGQLGRGTVDTNSASRRTPKKALLPYRCRRRAASTAP
ncbi:MAG: hypothetical protein KC416_14890, partial [Myxococcales bacterium]|nr:hypothetical protein [Myxococcales bacterium]